jgi:tetratricopeptide (TPR) repeat protein
VRFGSPPTLATEAYDAFDEPPPTVNDDLGRRLFSLSGSWRGEMWRVAWEEFKAHPLTGSGAGTYEQAWNRDRGISYSVRDAHGLYTETLSELGPVGLAFLLTTLGVPLVAALRTRHDPLVPGALGAYVAYVAHAGIDWDWEMTGVTLSALFCGVAIVLTSRRPRDRQSLPAPLRTASLAAVLVLAGVALVGLIGNSAVRASFQALAEADYRAADAEARKAARWLPWSSEPWHALARAQLARGNAEAARESFRRAIAKNARDWELWYGLALVSEGSARRSALAEAARLNPLQPEIVLALELVRER